jgi:hypothetical protein
MQCPRCNFNINIEYLQTRKVPACRNGCVILPVALSEEEKNSLMRLDANRALEDAYFPIELTGILLNPANDASIKYDSNKQEIVCVCNYTIDLRQ